MVGRVVGEFLTAGVAGGFVEHVVHVEEEGEAGGVGVGGAVCVLADLGHGGMVDEVEAAINADAELAGG